MTRGKSRTIPFQSSKNLLAQLTHRVATLRRNVQHWNTCRSQRAVDEKVAHSARATLVRTIIQLNRSHDFIRLRITQNKVDMLCADAIKSTHPKLRANAGANYNQIRKPHFDKEIKVFVNSLFEHDKERLFSRS